MMKNSKKFIILFVLLFITSCISVSDIIGSEDDDLSEVPIDEVGQLLSDIQSEQDEQFSTVEENQSEEKLEIADEKLEPVPAQEYDSVLLDQKEEQIEEVKEPEEIDLTDKAPVEQQSFERVESIISKLNIEDKIQYRVATINFYSGSSKVDNIGLKKIKKVANIAKTRNAKIKIVGHASKRTKDMPLAKHKLVNFNISDQRAQSVANIFLNKHSFPSTNLITEAVSDTKPLFKENMPAGTRANQRTEIFLIY